MLAYYNYYHTCLPNTKDNMLKCHRCNKICKNKTGLTLHYKKCLTSLQNKKKTSNSPTRNSGKIATTKKVSNGCIVCKSVVTVDNGLRYSDCNKYIHHGCLRCSRNIEALHCHSVFCKPRDYRYC